jgi:tetratricopeptide (TPR) repeat protein
MYKWCELPGVSKAEIFYVFLCHNSENKPEILGKQQSMNQPSVFISCVSPEFRQTRSRVAAILTRLGYTPVIQEIFGTEPDDLRQVLRDKIDACEGLIQIVGQGYGAEPPAVDAGYSRVSYTQFEFLYARSQKKKTWLIFAGEACTRDMPLERLDLPNGPAHPDPAGYQAERRALQLAYREKRREDGHIYYDTIGDTDLDLKVERLRDELAKLRQAFNIWQNKVLRGFGVVFVLLLLIGGSIWWFGTRQHWDLQRISAEARHITREKIRAQLLESAEHTHQTALAEAATAKAWEERERLRKAAEEANAARLSRIDELADSFAEIEGTSQSTQVFDEMTRILAEEGVDQAIAYVTTQRSGILEKVKARATAAREKNRADLLPLLKSAQLQTDRKLDEAERLLAEILAAEPDWTDALDAQFWFLMAEGNHAFNHATLDEALSRFHAAQSTVHRLLKAEPDAPRSQRDLSVSYEGIGDVQRAQGDLASALSSYKEGLGIREKLAMRDPGHTEWQRDLSVSYDRIGDVQRAKGDLASALSSYKQDLEIEKKLATHDPANTEWQRDLSVSYNKIGDMQRAQGDLVSALNSCKEGLEIARKLAARDPANTEWRRDLSVSYEGIGDVHRAQGDLASALSYYKEGLGIREKLAMRDPANTEWQRDLSVSYERIGDVQSVQGDLASALSSYTEGLGIREKLAMRDPANSVWRRDLSVSYNKIGDVQSVQGDLASGLNSYKEGLGISEKLAMRDPANTDWKIDLVISLSRVAMVLEQQGEPQKREAGPNYQRALEILRSLAGENRLTAKQQTWISLLEARLKAISSEDTKMAQ